MKKENLFREVSKICNYLDEKTVKDVYYAFVRVVSRELREKKSIVLPDWGEFCLILYKARMTHDINSGTFRKLEPKNVIKFIANRDLKKYFYQIDI